MRITLAFAIDKDAADAPWLLDAVDEYTEDANGGGKPEEYLEHLADHRKYGGEVREVLIEIDDNAVVERFNVPDVRVTLVPAEGDFDVL